MGAKPYKVELPPKIKHHPVFHISLLKSYHEDEGDLSKGHRWVKVQHDKEVEEILVDQVVQHSNDH